MGGTQSPSGGKKYPLALTELFATGTRRDMLQFLFTEADPERWYRKTDIADGAGRSGESIRNNLTRLIEFQIIEVRDPDAQIRHYQLAESEPVDLLQAWDESVTVLTTLLDGTARQEIMTFFLDVAEADESYTRYAVHNQAGVGYEPLREHMNVFVEYGLLTTSEGERSIEYSLAENDLVRYCYTLNEVLVQAFNDGE